MFCRYPNLPLPIAHFTADGRLQVCVCFQTGYLQSLWVFLGGFTLLGVKSSVFPCGAEAAHGGLVAELFALMRKEKEKHKRRDGLLQARFVVCVCVCVDMVCLPEREGDWGQTAISTASMTLPQRFKMVAPCTKAEKN